MMFFNLWLILTFFSKHDIYGTLAFIIGSVFSQCLGAFMRYLYNKGNINMIKICKKDRIYNYFIGLVTFVVLIQIYIYIFVE